MVLPWAHERECARVGPSWLSWRGTWRPPPRVRLEAAGEGELHALPTASTPIRMDALVVFEKDVEEEGMDETLVDFVTLPV